jgi:hypothetical protein
MRELQTGLCFQHGVLNIKESKMSDWLTCRVIAGVVIACAGVLIMPPPALAQKPVISSCSATPGTLAPGETATVHVHATSPTGAPLEYIYTASTGTIQGDGASATYTADASTTGVVTVLCEARSGESWVRSRTWIKVAGTATKSAAVPKQTPPHSESATAGAAPHPAPPPAVLTHPALPPATQAHAVTPQPAQPRSVPQPSVQAHVTTPPPTQAHAVTPPAPVQARPVTPVPAPTPTPAPVAPQVQVQSQSTPATAVPVPSNVAAEPAPSSNQQLDGSEFKRSKNGLIEYKVPQKMVAGTTSQVTVKIHGDQDKMKSPDGTQRKRSFRESQYMKVMLFAENSSEFEIVPQGTGNAHFVPVDGTATWTWRVTPTAPATDQNLQVRVYLDDGTDVEQDVDEASYTLTVNKPSLLAVIKRALFDDPDAWWKYWLPSGAFCIAMVALLTGFINRRYTKGSAATKPMAQDLV